MKYEIREAEKRDIPEMLEIFNWYAKNSPACYAEDAVPIEFMEAFFSKCRGYPSLVATDSRGKVVGFGNLHPHHPASSFKQTAEITYFLLDEVTGGGLGSRIHKMLIAGADELGIRSVMASISSLNKGSIRFHEKLGYQHCGRFKQVGNKNGRVFDVVWMQLKR
jgi:L-amino acid N-acyltransferase YncA